MGCFLKKIVNPLLPDMTTKATNMAVEKKYKYNLLKLYKELPRSVDFFKQLRKIGISERTFYRHGSIEKKSIQDITVDQLLKYAKVFGCEVDQLINQSKKIKTGLS